VTGRVFRRSLDPDLPVAVEASGSTIRDATGREYLDAAGGAVVVNVGHGRASIAREKPTRNAEPTTVVTMLRPRAANRRARRLPVDGRHGQPSSVHRARGRGSWGVNRKRRTAAGPAPLLNRGAVTSA
jgi:4-aminobutyrate aminotransferase-like enzyme